MIQFFYVIDEEDIGLSVGAARIAGQDRSMWRTLRPSAGQAQQWVSDWVSDRWRSKGMPSGTGNFLQHLIGELKTPKLAQIFAYSKWLYPYRMQLHGASDLDQRCLKTRKSAVVAFLGGSYQISPQKNHFGGPFDAKPIIKRVLCKSHVNGAIQSWNFTFI